MEDKQANDDDVHVKCALSKVLKNVTFETTKLEPWFLVISKRCLKWFGKVGNKSVRANSYWGYPDSLVYNLCLKL